MTKFHELYSISEVQHLNCDGGNAPRSCKSQMAASKQEVLKSQADADKIAIIPTDVPVFLRTTCSIVIL
jgi:hypothetical protein